MSLSCSPAPMVLPPTTTSVGSVPVAVPTPPPSPWPGWAGGAVPPRSATKVTFTFKLPQIRRESREGPEAGAGWCRHYGGRTF